MSIRKFFLSLSKISFHPKLAAVLDFIVSLIFLGALNYVWVWWVLLIWIAARVGLWAVLVRLVYFPPEAKRVRHWLSLFIFFVGDLLLLLFTEWSMAWYTAVTVLIVFPAISFWFLPIKDAGMSFVFKPYRRWQFVLAVCGLGGIISGLFAVQAFQLFNILTRWPYILVGTLISTAVAYWWWKEYEIKFDLRLSRWLVVWAIISCELLWVLFLWPLGYLLLGILFIWFWYIFWLMVRFNLSKEGVLWKKQRLFLFINIVALIAYLVFLARWR